MKHVLATKSGNLIPVKPTFKTNTWVDAHSKESFYVSPNDPNRKVFSGEDSMDQALKYIEGTEKIEHKNGQIHVR